MNEQAQTLLTASQPTQPDTNLPADVQPTPQADTPPQSAQKFLADDAGSFAEGWRSLLPEDIRDAKSLDSIKSVQALANSYVNAQRMVGANKMVVPGETSTPEEWGKVYDALGRPKEAKDYTLPEGMQWDSDTQRDFVLTSFHDAGLSDRQAGQMLKVYGDIVREAMGRMDQARADSEAALRKEWGMTFDSNIGMANKALAQLGLDKVLSGNAVLNDAGFIRAMAAIGKGVGETRIGNAGSVSAGDDRLDSILRDRRGAYYDATSPDHARAVDEVSRLLAARAKR